MKIEKEFKFKFLKVESQKIFFKSSYPWKICLNANSEIIVEGNYFYLEFNNFNISKLGKLFSEIWKNFYGLSTLKNEFKNLELRPYQKEDVEFLSSHDSVAIFNEMRTGKTPTSLMLCKKWFANKILVICPSILQNQWQTSIEDWLKIPSYVIGNLPLEDRIFIYEKFFVQNGFSIVISKDLFKADYIVFNSIRKLNNFSSDFCVIVDESHFLRNYDSQQSKAIFSLSYAKFKVVLTGTPFVNKYSDIFGILKFLYPLEYKSNLKFLNEYFKIRNIEFKKGNKKICIKEVIGFKNSNFKDRFINKISSFSVKRKQSEVLPWIPNVIRTKEYLIMEEKQEELYQKWLRKGKYSEKLFNLKSIILYPPYLDKDLKSDGAKINYLLFFCLENTDKQIVIFSTRSDTFLIPLSLRLSEKDVNFGIIVGKTDHKKRIENIRDFQNFKIKILLCNIQSAGFGLELSSADTLIFADRCYSPADNEQAEARFIPTKDDKKSNVKLIIDLICKGTIDEKIIKLLEKKKDITSVLNTEPNLIFD